MLSTLTLLVSHFLSPHIVFMIQPSEPIQSCGLYQAFPLLSAAGFPISHQFPHPNYNFHTSFFFLLSHGPPISSRSSLTSPLYIAFNLFPFNSVSPLLHFYLRTCNPSDEQAEKLSQWAVMSFCFSNIKYPFFPFVFMERLLFHPFHICSVACQPRQLFWFHSANPRCFHFLLWISLEIKTC